MLENGKGRLKERRKKGESGNREKGAYMKGDKVRGMIC